MTLSHRTLSHKPKLHQDWIDFNALTIVKALQRAGHTTYLVGGCVRDLLLQCHPKDFDIATTALPEEVQKIVPRSHIIGKRFRLVLVKRQGHQYEISTFRKTLVPEAKPEMDAPENGQNNGNGNGEPILGDNVFGTPEEDALRRDFTVNGLFYDPVNEDLIDFVNGKQDLKNRIIRMIGDPITRLEEDPIRIMRALRLSHLIHFTLEEELRFGMLKMAHKLPETVLPRRREEILKWLRLPRPHAAFAEAYDLGLLEYLTPTLHNWLDKYGGHDFFELMEQMHSTGINAKEPAEVFGYLVAAAVHSFVIHDSFPPKDKAWMDDPQLNKWMHEELGLFKSEQSHVLRSIQMITILSKRKEFEAKGERRRLAVLRNEAFPLGLKLANQFRLLPPADSYFWSEQAKIVFESEDNDPPERRRNPRRRTRRPGRGPQGPPKERGN